MTASPKRRAPRITDKQTDKQRLDYLERCGVVSVLRVVRTADGGVQVHCMSLSVSALRQSLDLQMMLPNDLTPEVTRACGTPEVPDAR